MSYFCWATLMMKAYENDIVANMMKKDYHVRGGLVDGSISRTNKDSNTTMLIILVDPGAKKTEMTAAKIMEDFKKALKESKALYYDVIVHAQCDASYTMSNIVLPENPEQPSRPANEL